MNKKIFLKAIIFVSALIAAVIGITSAVSGSLPDGSSPEKIIAFLSEHGYTVASPTVKTVTIPEEFGEVYKEYNKLQKSQGFDLSRYKGREAVSYTFAVIGCIGEDGQPDESVQAHILVCGGKIIGGDIASARLDGFMHGF